MRLFVILLLSLSGLNTYAEECTEPNAKTENVAEYLGKMAESLSHIKRQFQKITTVQSKKDADATDVLVALKELKAGYFCSSSMIGSYKKSENENISKSAETLSESYQMLGSGVEGSIADFKLKLDGKVKTSPGEQADQDAEKMLLVKKKWELVIISIGLGIMSGVKDNPKTKKGDTLVITRAERDEVVKTLKAEFLLPKKKGDSDPIDAAADIYFNWLTRGWKFN